jgi:hypothetical protein
LSELKEKCVWLLKDAGSGFGMLNSQNAFLTMTFLSSVTIASLTDEETRDTVQSNQTNFLKYYTNITNEFGSATYIVPASIGLYGISLFTNSQEFSDASFTAFESLELAMLITGGLKIASGRARPEQELGSRDFNMFKGTQDSFPSGHTTVAFAFITPYAEYLGPPYSYVLYFLATSTAFARLYRDAHWLSDVVAGAGIGYVVGRSLVTLHKGRRDNLKLTFIIDNNQKSIAVSYKF